MGVSFVLSAADAAAEVSSRGLSSVQQLARHLVTEAEVEAWPGVSNYRVGAVVIGQSGALYLGVNLEFPPLPINGDTVHAEQFAATLAFLQGERQLQAMVTARGYPCGHCRQFLSEIDTIDSVVFLAAEDEQTCNSIQTLLPGGMRPFALENGEAPALGDGDSGQSAPGCSLFGSRLGPLPEPPRWRELSPEPAVSINRPLLEAAMMACARSHAPYTGNRAGISLLLRLDDGACPQQHVRQHN
jgi:cytidine deaminase